MIWFLRFLFTLVLVAMVVVTTWAGMQSPVFGVPEEMAAHPWFMVTLFEAYAGFLTFFVWVCYKQTSWAARLGWLVAILLLGNIAIASYCLRELFAVDRRAPVADVLTARRDGSGWLGWSLALIGAIVVIAASQNLG